LLVIDSNSNLTKSVEKVQATMVTTLVRGIPNGMFDLTVLARDEATPTKIQPSQHESSFCKSLSIR